MTAREWLDAVEVRQATAATPLMPHWNYQQQVAWDRARSVVIRTDLPALVAVLRAVLDECDDSDSVAFKHGRYPAVGRIDTRKIRAVIDAHLGGAS